VKLRWLLVAAIALLLHTGSALAQPEEARSAGPDVPAGPAAVSGRIVHETRPAAAAEVEVILYALSEDGGAGLRVGVTDAEGRFRFENVSNAPGVVYLLGARSGEIPFGSRFTFGAGEREHRVELVLSDPVRDADAAEAGGFDLRIERGCTHLRVSHSHAVTNPGERVVYIPEAERADAPPIFEVVLPAGVEGFETIQGREGLVRDGARVRFYGPVYPGTQQVEFGYGLALDTRHLEIGLPGGTPEAGVLTPVDVLEATSDALTAAPGIPLGAQPYAVQRSGAIAPGGVLALDLSLPEMQASTILTPRAELWLELDDAALEVNERLEVVVEQPGGLAESMGQPLLCMPLPIGALELRFSSEMLQAGLRRDPSGDLAIHGPLPSGATSLAVSYRIPARSSGVDLTRRWDRDVSLLSVLVADNGVVPETTRLHRRRAVRSDERMFQHLEAFAIEPLEPVEIDLRRTPPQRADGGWASAGFALLAGLAALGFLSAPLRGGAEARGEREASPAADALELEREAFARSLEDLDDDLATWKLSAEDHSAMRTELRARAAASLLRAPDEAAPEEPAGTPATPLCGSCGHAARPGDAFCAKCGSRLDAGTPA
jgi:hypothetical protein